MVVPLEEENKNSSEVQGDEFHQQYSVVQYAVERLIRGFFSIIQIAVSLYSIIVRILEVDAIRSK